LRVADEMVRHGVVIRGARNLVMSDTKKPRRPVSPMVRDEVLREAGYMCANPRCRHILTLELHHIVWVRDRGSNSATNLIALCPNCHALHTRGHIPADAIRHWKGILHALNHAFSKESMDLLLYLNVKDVDRVWYTGDALLRFAGLIAADLAEVAERASALGVVQKNAGLAALIVGSDRPLPHERTPATAVRVALTDKGKALVDAWLSGDKDAYLRAVKQQRSPRVGRADSQDPRPNKSEVGDGHPDD
jgi:HNH endonuclease